MNLLTPTVQVARGTAGTPMTTWTRPSARFVIVATIRNAANVANKTSTKNLTLTSLIILFMSLIQINLKNVSHAGWGWHQQLLCQDLRWEAIKNRIHRNSMTIKHVKEWNNCSLQEESVLLPTSSQETSASVPSLPAIPTRWGHSQWDTNWL